MKPCSFWEPGARKATGTASDRRWLEAAPDRRSVCEMHDPAVPHPVFWTRGRPKHQAALRLSFWRARAGVRYPCRWRSQPLL